MGSWLAKVLPRSALTAGGSTLVVVVALAAGGVVARSSETSPPGVIPVGGAQSAPPGGSATTAGSTGTFSGIVLPDPLIARSPATSGDQRGQEDDHLRRGAGHAGR